MKTKSILKKTATRGRHRLLFLLAFIPVLILSQGANAQTFIIIFLYYQKCLFAKFLSKFYISDATH